MRFSAFLPIWVSLFFFFAFKFLPLSGSILAASNVTFYGDAHLRHDAISLTQEHKCSQPSSSSSFPASFTSTGVGRAIYLYPIQFIDPTTNTPASFSCRFSFTIIQSPGCPFGDGMAFLITSSADSFSFSNGYIGLPGPALNPQDSFIAVEFDTHSDASFSDINDNHIGIDVNTIVSFASVDAMSNGLDLRSRRQITAWIEYIDVAKLVRVWASYSHTKPKIPILEARIDLSEHFKEYMNVGFTAGNGQGSAVHIVDHWQFRTFWSPPSVNPTGEENCFMCYLQDSDEIENPNHKFQERRTKIREVGLGLGGLSAFLVSIVAIISIIIFFLTKKNNGNSRICKGDGSGPTRLSIAEIKAATLGFHRSRVIGEGASATVYKGFLPSVGAVAIKRFNKAQIDCSRNPFITEFATIVGCLKHKNLVQLQGWCCEKAELVLVYEFLPNGTLDKKLHDNSSSSVIFLSWKQRVNIVLGVAAALSYLHEECERQIIHRDVKTCNIMLDEEYNPKVGDFGLAEVYEHSTLTREATIPAGTMGYLAPEYVYSGIPSAKTDVYSFGVVVLEVATGRRPVDDNGIVVVDWVWNLWEQGQLIKATDSKLKGKYNGVEMERMLLIGLSCVHPNHEERPTMKEAAKILKGEAPLPILPCRKPKVGFQYSLPEYSQERTATAAATVGGDSSSGTDDLTWLTPKSQFGY
ncbi:L-type lectin-domain containing receptor kinase S.6 [Euphorbia lathyris]|uniref:L-type lectin-domain containing receptor kinase S.6 n=1 Tax=Euphorbia lathyris TaxID=212925 RepID=UPI003314158A